MPKNSVNIRGRVSGGVVSAGDRNTISKVGPTERKMSVDIKDSHGNVVAAGGRDTGVEGGVRNQPSMGVSQAVNLTEVRELIIGLRRALPALDVPAEIKEEIEAELDTGLAQLRKKEPDTGLVKMALQNAAKAVGALAATGAVHQLIQGVTAITSML